MTLVCRLLSGVALFISLCGRAQPLADSLSIASYKRNGVLLTHSVGALGSFIVLNQLWYADYPRQSFHVTNDWNDWNKMDKLGHMWSAYTISRLSAASWKWAGTTEVRAEIIGTASALGFQTAIELADGFSSHWGFSWGDVAANTLGGSLYLAQQLVWQQQRVQLKVMAYRPYSYTAAFEPRVHELFGKTLLAQLLNDYNIQTYWLSTTIKSWFPGSTLPDWLGVSVGYGSQLMLGRNQNQWLNAQGTLLDYSGIARHGRFLIAPDVDLTKIRTRSRFLRTAFLIVNVIKLPLPVLEITAGKVQVYPLFFN